MIQLKKITQDNIEDILKLDVAEDQQELVAPNAVSLAQAYVTPKAMPYAIYQDEIPVGFVMYILDPEDNEYWIWRLMIDKNHQAKGYGKDAMDIVINEIKKDTSKQKIFISVVPQGVGSKRLYIKLGFKYTGEIVDGEEVMVLNY